MKCKRCGWENDESGSSCVRCGSSTDSPDRRSEPRTSDSPRAGLSSADSEFTLGLASPEVEGDRGAAPDLQDLLKPETGPLEIGEPFGSRYQILRLLGIGGMGAVYEAFDRELEVSVALKVIRMDGVDEEKAEALGARFKRELLLARGVTHKNVVRIHDLGDLDGIKYFTMTYIEGENLDALLERRQKLGVSESLSIVRQVAEGLVAAHEAGVVHRDLKPANVMLDTEGNALLMDFGIARSAEPGDGESGEKSGERVAEEERTTSAEPSESDLVDEESEDSDPAKTQTGTVLGTMQYMAPEQYYGDTVDQRADMYALGLMFYDMVLGKRDRRARASISELMSRLKSPPPLVRSVDSQIPEAVERIIDRCLQPDPDDRFESTAELLAALDRLDANGNPLPRLSKRAILAIASGLVAVVLALLATWWIGRQGAAPLEEPDPISLLIADFENTTGDEAFDGSLEQALGIALEGASFISTYSRPSAERIVRQLEGSDSLDEATARLVSRREGIDVVVTGSVVPAGNGYRIDVEAVDAALDDARNLASSSARVSSREEVLEAVGRVASDLRRRLGDSKPESARLADSETFTAGSLEAMKAYALAQDLSFQAEFDSALLQYQRAVDLDPEFGRAYAGMGVLYGNLDQMDRAEESYQEALRHLSRMTERERYRTMGGYYLLVSRNYEKAIENYGMLVELFPADRAGHSNLALAYLYTRDFDRALSEGRVAVELEPNNLIHRLNFAMYAHYAGDFDLSIAESSRTLEDNPGFAYATFTLARAAAAKGDFDAASSSYAELGRSPDGAGLAAIGQADLAMARGRWEQALEIAEDSLQESQDTPQPAMQLVRSEALLMLGRVDEAADVARALVGSSNEESVLYPAGRVLVAAQQRVGVLEATTKLESLLQSQSSSYARLLQGEMALDEGDLPKAMTALREGWQVYDSWFAHFLLGRAYFEAERFPEALDELELCLRRKGEATDVFLNDSSTLRYFVPALYWIGRSREMVSGPEAAREAYAMYLDLRGNSPENDPFAASALERIGLATTESDP